MSIVFLGDIDEGHLSLKDADDGQINFAAKIKNLDKGKKAIEKKLNNLGLLFSAKKNVLNNFKSRLFPTKKIEKIPTREPTVDLATRPIKDMRSKSKLQQEFMNEIIANENDLNDKILWNYFNYQNPFNLAKDLIGATQAKKEQLLDNVNNEMIGLRNAIFRKQISENENRNKIVEIVKKVLDFNKQQEGKGIKN